MDENKTNPPAGGSALPNKPLFVTEEESSAPVHPPPIAIPPVTSAPPMPMPPSPPPASGGSMLPPVVSPPPKKSKGKLVAGVVAALLIIIGLPLGYLAVRQNQDIRKSASVAEPCNVCSSGICTGVASPPQCSHSQDECSSDSECPAATATPVATATPTPDTVNSCSSVSGQYCTADRCSDGGDVAGNGTCPGNAPNCCGAPRSTPAATATPVATTTPGTGGGGGGSCDRDAQLAKVGPIVSSSDNMRIDDTSVSCEVVRQFVDKWGDRSGRRWAVERTCETSVAESCDGNKTLDGEQANIVADFIGRFGTNACSKWVTDHNTAVNNCQTGTANQCKQVKVYKYPYNAGNLVSAPYDGKLAPGDFVKFCLEVVGSGNPEVNVNNTGWSAATEVNPNQERCLQYDIPSDATQLSIQGRF